MVYGQQANGTCIVCRPAKGAISSAATRRDGAKRQSLATPASAMANQQQRSPTAAGGTPPQANYQPQRTAAAPGGNAPPARSNAQPYQQQRPTQQPVAQQRSAGGEYGQLNQGMQNRQRGAVQSQRFSQAGKGGGRGAGFRR